MMLKVTGAITASAKIQYLCTMLRGEVLRQIDNFYVKVRSVTTIHLHRIILDLDSYVFPVNAMPDQKHAMLRKISKP